MRLKRVSLGLFLFVVLTTLASIGFAETSREYTTAQRVKFDALQKKVKADDGSNYVALKKEVESFLKKHDQRNKGEFKNTASMGTRVRKLESTLRLAANKYNQKNLEASSVVNRLGMNAEDVFDHKKVIEAFSKSSPKDMYRLPKIKFPARSIVTPKSNVSRVKYGNKKEVDVSWGGDQKRHTVFSRTTVPKPKAPEEGTIVLLWNIEKRRNYIVTAAGEVFAASLSPDSRGNIGEKWGAPQLEFISEKHAKALSENGTLNKKVYKKFGKATDAMWKCSNGVSRKFEKKGKKIENKNAKASIRNKKLKANRAATYKALKSCDKKKAKYQKQMETVAGVLLEARAKTLETIKTAKK